ncbi:MAG TPA: DsbA family protein [Myxococcota bacterium]|nr:DsbA family protein [Myxococcota bacterium]
MSARVTVCVDFKSPHAWLAIAPTRALEARLGERFDWRPRSVLPLPRPAPLGPHATRGERHRAVRAAYWERDLARYAESQGLHLRDPYREVDAVRPSLALLFLRERAPERAGELVAGAFEAIWQHDAAQAPLESLGPGFEDWARKDGPEALAANEAELEELGVWNVPAYLVGGELFMGRQHLPMVEWLVRGRAGPAPI